MSASKILTLEGASSSYFSIMAIWVVKFSREGYKIRLIHCCPKINIQRKLKCRKLTFKVNFLSQNSKSISIFLTFRIEQYHIFCDCYFLITSIFKTLHVLLTSRYQVYLQNTYNNFL